MAMRKSDIEHQNAKQSQDAPDDVYGENSAESVNTMSEAGQTSTHDMAARKRLEEYFEERRLRKEIDDELFDT